MTDAQATYFLKSETPLSFKVDTHVLLMFFVDFSRPTE